MSPNITEAYNRLKQEYEVLSFPHLSAQINNKLNKFRESMEKALQEARDEVRNLRLQNARSNEMLFQNELSLDQVRK